MPPPPPPSIVLQAVHGPDEVLRGEVTQRSDITVASATITLGKNALTGIADSGLRRKMVAIRTTTTSHAAKLQLQVPEDVSSHGGVVLLNYATVPNGTTRPLHHGDVVTLSSSSSSGGTDHHHHHRVYSYRVVLPPTEDDTNSSSTSPNKKRRVESTTTNNKATTSKQQRAADEMACPICLDILVRATLLVRTY